MCEPTILPTIGTVAIGFAKKTENHLCRGIAQTKHYVTIKVALDQSLKLEFGGMGRMPRPKHQWAYGYDDIQKLTGKSLNVLYQDVARGDLDPTNLEGVVIYLSRHGKLDLKVAMFRAAMSRIESDDVEAKERKVLAGLKA